MEELSLLVDARNALYRAIYAAKAERHRNGYHNIIYLLRQISSWIRQLNPTSVHIFWDAPRKTVWRREILSTYKDRTNSQYVDDITEDLANTTEVAMELFKYLNLRQYSKKKMEADDLIYAASVTLHPKPSIIISSDSDMMQIPYMVSSSKVYDPKTLIENEIPRHHPAMMKSIVGDKSDCIAGYYGIGPKKGSLLIENFQHLQEFLELKGRDVYHRNLLLTDLSLCPKLMSNRLYIQRIMSQSVCYDKDKVKETSKSYKLLGFDSEFANLIPPFQSLK